MKAFQRLTLLIFCIGSFALSAQQDTVSTTKTDNKLTFMVISEKVKTRGMMEYCITDTSGMCISNLQSGLEVHIFNKADQELWAGKTAGRNPMLKFPRPFPNAHYLVLKAFKPFVLNKATGNRIYQDQPIELKYILE